MHIETFTMERTQCLYESTVELNLSESGVKPLRVDELLDTPAERERFLANGLWYCESDGSQTLRERIAQFYPGADASNITVTNGGSEANYVSLWSLLAQEGRLACMLPNYLQAWGLGHAWAGGVDAFRLELRDGRWALDLDSLERAVTKQTRVILVTNPNNPTGAVLNAAEMDAVLDAARRSGAWLIVDEIYRGAEAPDAAPTPTFWGRYDKLVVTSGLSKAFGLPGLRIGWVVAPPEFIELTHIRHDYLTLTPGLLNDRLAALAMEPLKREAILARTRGIVAANLPAVEQWIEAQGDKLQYARPRAGAIAYLRYRAPIESAELFEQLRREHSVLITPAAHFGDIDQAIRVGFGYDAERTLRGLARVEQCLGTVG